jgi:hypothetical protein
MMLKSQLHKYIFFACLLLAANHGFAQTSAGFEFSSKLGFYEYKEPGYMKIDGPVLGLGAKYSHALGTDDFIQIDASGNAGFLDYQGSGNLNNTENYSTDVRALYLKNYTLKEGTVLTPYAGLGYRFLYNDLRGITTTGASGYRRLSHYVYLPVGVMTYLNDGYGNKIELNAEVGLLIRGYQQSYLSDVFSNVSDLKNEQKTGHNLRLSALYKFESVYVGPYYNRWSVGRSSVENGWVEPKNSTNEFGLMLKFKY